MSAEEAYEMFYAEENDYLVYAEYEINYKDDSYAFHSFDVNPGLIYKFGIKLDCYLDPWTGEKLNWWGESYKGCDLFLCADENLGMQ